jgi:hypothetical protein
MSEPAENGPPTRDTRAAAPVRVFVDAEGTRWQVSERPFSDYDRRHGLSLIFASEVAVRRVRDYPANWATLADDELFALSWRA